MEGTTSTGRAVGPAAGPSGAAGGGWDFFGMRGMNDVIEVCVIVLMFP